VSPLPAVPVGFRLSIFSSPPQATDSVAPIDNVTANAHRANHRQELLVMRALQGKGAE
jgi:hypothetical protein